MRASAQISNKKYDRHQLEWQDAQRAADIFFKKNPNNFFRLIEEIVNEIFLDKEIKVEAGYGKVTKAVENKQEALLWESCWKATEIYFAANPRDLRCRPARIAKEINEAREYAFPFGMLTAIVGKQQEALREKERQHSIVIAGNV